MKLGFIGAGFIARFQAVAVQQVRGLEIAGITKRRGSEALATFCRSHGLGQAKVYDTIAEMAKQVDVLAIYVPNYARIEVMEQIVAAVKAGANTCSLPTILDALIAIRTPRAGHSSTT